MTSPLLPRRCAINRGAVISPQEIVAVIPAFNCETTIKPVVERLRLRVREVVVVDDGSTDQTARVAAASGATVVCLSRNMGKGAALRRGLEVALRTGPRLIALLDADGQHDPEDLPALLEVYEREGSPLVVGCRLGNRAAIPAVRFWTNYIGTRILSWMTGQELLDSQSGYRLLEAKLAEVLSLEASGYAIETEMLIRAAALGVQIGHAPIRTIYPVAGTSHFRPLEDTVRIAWEAIVCKVFRVDS